ncbi:MAG: septal ring lytic transglycosylase RlpA family protein [Thiogranum sp.]
MKNPQMIVMNPILLMLLFVVNVNVHAEVATDVMEGEASYYADSLHGNKTASGAPYDKDAMTAAHRSLPFDTRVKVTYLKTGKSVEVVINDRGPHAKGRIIDLSGAAAQAVGLVEDGHGKVKLEVVAP